jgi:hypothetical protein
MLTVAKNTVEVSLVVARPVVATALVLDEESGSLAVLLPLIVLLAIFHQPALASVCRLLPLPLDDRCARLLRRPRVKLLDDARARLRAMLPLGVILRAFLLPRSGVLGVHESLDRVTAVVFPLAHLLLLLVMWVKTDGRERFGRPLESRA